MSFPSFPPKTLIVQSPIFFTYFSSPISSTPTFRVPKAASTKLLPRLSNTQHDTVPQSAIQRIAEKLRSLGFKENEAADEDTPPKPSAGEIFIPLPKQLPKHRVGHTIDTSWSTPENPVPRPGSGGFLERYGQLRREVRKERELAKKRTREEKAAPTLAELRLSPEELRRLRGIGVKLKKKLKVGKAGITEGIVNGIHERWRRQEVVKIECEDLCRRNMKRTHDLLERKTGGLVVWRSGSNIILYRGTDYKYPYFLANDILLGGPSASSDCSQTNAKESCPPSIDRLEAAQTSAADKVPQKTLIHGVGSPNKVRFQLPGEAELAEEANRLLEGLGPRFTDWWGYEPLPVDADLLPAVVPGYRKPLRLLPYGVNTKLTNDEMTILRRLSRPLPCHFALGRNRNLQGLAASIVKLWEKCEIAKIAVKRGVQNTNSEIMAEELRWLTGGLLLSRDREFIVLYRGKDFLPPVVSSAIEERRKYGIGNDKVADIQDGFNLPSSVHEDGDPNKQLKLAWSGEKNTASLEAAIRKTDLKLSLALEEKARAEKLLAELENTENHEQVDLDKEGITEEERYMLRKVGLRMGPFLLLGRRGVYDGTIENMHLHWKYRELVKVIFKEKRVEDVYQVAQTLEAESGGILVAVERVSKGYAIIVYRGKNYVRPASLRPKTLLNKRAAMKRSLEAQRYESLKLHVLKLSENIDQLRLQLDRDKERHNTHSLDSSCSQLVAEEMNSIQTVDSASRDVADEVALDSYQEVANSDPELMQAGGERGSCLTSTDSSEEVDGSMNKLQSLQADDLVDSSEHCDTRETTLIQSQTSKESNRRHSQLSVSMHRSDEGGFGTSKNSMSKQRNPVIVDAEHPVSSSQAVESSDPSSGMGDSGLEKLIGSCEMPARPANLSNRERLLLRKQALRMRKRPVLAIGRSNIVTGVAKAIKAHFQKHPLAIVNVKGRAKGTSIQEVVFKLEQATGAVMVSQEPNKVILYRGWGAEEESSLTYKKARMKVKLPVNSQQAYPPVSPELMAAIELECGLQSNQGKEIL